MDQHQWHCLDHGTKLQTSYVNYRIYTAHLQNLAWYNLIDPRIYQELLFSDARSKPAIDICSATNFVGSDPRTPHLTLCWIRGFITIVWRPDTLPFQNPHILAFDDKVIFRCSRAFSWCGTGKVGMDFPSTLLIPTQNSQRTESQSVSSPAPSPLV